MLIGEFSRKLVWVAHFQLQLPSSLTTNTDGKFVEDSGGPSYSGKYSRVSARTMMQEENEPLSLQLQYIYIW